MNRRAARGLGALIAWGGILLFFLAAAAIHAISAIPRETWVYLAILVGSSSACVAFVCTGKRGEALRKRASAVRASRADADPEASRQNRVKVLTREINRLWLERTVVVRYGSKQELADLERELAVAKRELRSIWKPSDYGWPE